MGPITQSRVNVRTLARQGQRLAMTALSPSAVDCRLTAVDFFWHKGMICWLVVWNIWIIFIYFP
jgi:hypothetical protein